MHMVMVERWMMSMKLKLKHALPLRRNPAGFRDASRRALPRARYEYYSYTLLHNLLTLALQHNYLPHDIYRLKVPSR